LLANTAEVVADKGKTTVESLWGNRGENPATFGVIGVGWYLSQEAGLG